MKFWTFVRISIISPIFKEENLNFSNGNSKALKCVIWQSSQAYKKMRNGVEVWDGVIKKDCWWKTENWKMFSLSLASPLCLCNAIDYYVPLVGMYKIVDGIICFIYLRMLQVRTHG